VIKLLLGLLLAFCAPVKAQQQIIQSDKFCGLDDIDPPNTLPDCAGQDVLNVESSVLGKSLKKRKGYIKQNTMSIATSPVTGSLRYFDVNGNNTVIVCNDINCAQSLNGGTFSNFVTTATVNIRFWSLVAANGISYGANDKQDKVWVLSNGSLSYSNTIPKCKILDVTKDRMVCANTNANPNSVNYSKQGDFTTWTIGALSVDPWTDNIGNPGQQITGLKNWNGTEYIFMDQSITACQLGDQYNTQCNQISPAVGTSDPLSIIITPRGIMFKGSDGNYWLIGPQDIMRPISLRIKNLLSTAASGKQYSNTQTTQADWQAGTQTQSGNWNTVDTPGSILPSTTTLGDFGGSKFITPNTFLNVSTATGVLALSSNTFSDICNGSTAGSLWTAESGSSKYNCVANSFFPAQAGGGAMWASSYVSSGSFSWSTNMNASGGIFDMYFMSLSTTTHTGYYAEITGGATIALKKGPAGTTLCTGPSNTQSGVSIPYNIFVSTSGHFIVSASTGAAMIVQCEAYDTTYSSSTFVEVATNKSNLSFSLISFYGYHHTGKYVSVGFDSGFAPPAVPIYGMFNSTFTTALNNIEYQTVFWTNTSVDNASWNANVASSDTFRVLSANRRYSRYEIDFTTNISTKTPTVTSANWVAASTGAYVSQCINTNGMSTSYGLLSCDTTLAGGGSIVYASSGTASCAQPPDVTLAWTSVTNNTIPTISTNTVTWLRFDSLLSSGTDQAQINSCTLNWVNGTLAPTVFGLYDPLGNNALWSFSVNQSSYTNRVLKYDLNNDAMYPFSLNASSLLYNNNAIYFGGSNGGYWNLYGNADNDNGQAINAYFKTKDFNCGDPFQEGIFQDFSMVNVNQNSSSMTNTYILGNGITNNYSVSLSTDSTKAYVRSNKALPITSPVSFANFKLGNNAANQPFELVGYRIGCSKIPWRVITP